jgi:glyceraldehyde-3-phosphate dehydrogenase (NADP+)
MNLNWTPCPPDRDAPTANGRRYLVDGEIRHWNGAAVTVKSPVFQPAGQGGALVQRELGELAQLDRDAALGALSAAAKAWGRGRGFWPTMSVAARIECVEDFLARMEARRFEVARLITWEVAKPWADTLVEFDRTIAYGRATVEALKDLDRTSSRFALDSGFMAQIRRAPLGVVLCMGPYNYPLNETYTTLLPALIMGNVIVMKPPRIGVLCHLPMLDDFASAFPPGVVNVICGDGDTIVGPIMASGQVDVLAFIGSTRVADLLKKAHPSPSRLRSVLGLGAKNPAVVLPDADIELAVKEGVDGALTFGGQRCTALKTFLVHRSIVDRFVAGVVDAVNTLPAGMPFADGVKLTPLPDDETVRKMTALVDDAVAKGARVVNAGGGGIDRTYFHPAVLYPVDARMKIWRREQFGPIVPIAAFDDVDEVLDYVVTSRHGQQASVFGSDPQAVGRLIDAFATQVCRINLNCQCRRGPDTFPFGGRKESAEGTLSVTDALRVFSIRALVAATRSELNEGVARQVMLGRHSQFLNTDFLF